MDDKILRLKCLKMAVNTGTVEHRIADAKKLWSFISDEVVSVESPDVMSIPTSTISSEDLSRNKDLLTLTMRTALLNKEVDDCAHCNIQYAEYPEGIKEAAKSLNNITRHNHALTTAPVIKNEWRVNPSTNSSSFLYQEKPVDGLRDLYEKELLNMASKKIVKSKPTKLKVSGKKKTTSVKK